MIHLFVFAGQSNAAGYGKRLLLSPVPTWAQTAANGWEGAPTASSDSGVAYPHPTLANSPSRYVENNTGLLAGALDGWGAYDGCNPPGPVHPGEQGSYGPELSFLARWRADHPGEALAAVKCVLGGSSLAEWSPPGGSMWTVLTTMLDQARARLANEEVDWAGLVWMQGESGAATVYPYLHPTPGQEYSDQLRVFLAAVRARYAPALPVALGRIGSHLLASNIIDPLVATDPRYSAAQYRAATEYRRSQQVLVGTDPRCAWWDCDGLPVLQSGDPQWWYHHTGAGYLAAGERAYTAWQRAVGEVPPPPPPPLVVEVREGGAVDPTRTAAVWLNGRPVGGPGDALVVEISARAG